MSPEPIRDKLFQNQSIPTFLNLIIYLLAILSVFMMHLMTLSLLFHNKVNHIFPLNETKYQSDKNEKKQK